MHSVIDSVELVILNVECVTTEESYSDGLADSHRDHYTDALAVRYPCASSRAQRAALSLCALHTRTQGFGTRCSAWPLRERRVGRAEQEGDGHREDDQPHPRTHLRRSRGNARAAPSYSVNEQASGGDDSTVMTSPAAEEPMLLRSS